MILNQGENPNSVRGYSAEFLDALASLVLVMSVVHRNFREIFGQSINKTLRHTDFQTLPSYNFAT